MQVAIAIIFYGTDVVLASVIMIGTTSDVTVRIGSGADAVATTSSDHDSLIRSASFDPMRRPVVAIFMSAIVAVVNVSRVANFSIVNPAVISLASAGLTPLIQLSIAIVIAGRSPRDSARSSLV